MTVSLPAASKLPKPAKLTTADLRAALAEGWRDLRAAPLYGIFFASFWVAGGWFLLAALTLTGRIWWTIPASFGFPLLGPFIAVGLYEVSRRLSQGEALSWGGVLGVIFAQRNRQLPSIAAVIVVYFLFWNFLSHVVFALFLGTKVMTNISSSFEVFLSPEGLAMLGFGTLAGAVFAWLLYSLTVVALPLLLDREVDFVTAMLTSLDVVKANPGVMTAWGLLIAVLVFCAMLPGFLGLFVVLPWLGHASWHLYRRALP
ncbi:DUF2189 domain-containing protein [Falsigemmobacter faecalis]|uniref:DUF2189 domain-containing protein n=1 Tax=Falsigemmobacter faecalis TaxID=2488730 RepID=A0A3P3DG08_9RHOB|nr:DUF2189 domain-containing protein [Falsigemmobacter faecalis]RRH72596.1 DUF2189 domain-containing protein [Falsigemmobacter faecalis]